MGVYALGQQLHVCVPSHNTTHALRNKLSLLSNVFVFTMRLLDLGPLSLWFKAFPDIFFCVVAGFHHRPTVL
jgi:hypothetical protein